MKEKATMVLRATACLHHSLHWCNPSVETGWTGDPGEGGGGSRVHRGHFSNREGELWNPEAAVPLVGLETEPALY